MVFRKIACLAVASISLNACALLYNDANEALTIPERHPITVDQQTYSMTVNVDPTVSALSRDVVAELDDFMRIYRTKGHGPLTVTSPSGASTDLDGQQTAAQVRQALNALGLAYTDMQGSTYRTAERLAPVIVSFTQYVASAPVCGAFDSALVNQYKNISPRNFGCADQHNLAAMLADPRDLTAVPRAATSNSVGLVTAIEQGAVPSQSESN
ncbi:MAG: CpaD family pilus assembly protein [Pseudomonadota bacterium]